MTIELALVCKSYRNDLRRVQRLLGSLDRHNVDRLPVFVVVPETDRHLFEQALPAKTYELITDETVAQSHPQSGPLKLLERYRATPGARSQQVIKSEAWRAIGCENYLCMDSDTVFLKPFRLRDFVAGDGIPYTVMHQSREYLQLACDRGHDAVWQHFQAESEAVKQPLGRAGPHYDFGPQPLIWSARVWSSLHDQWLAPRGLTLWDAIDLAPTEIRWYGEALLAFGAVPLRPIEPLFRVYHHAWQYDLMKRLGENEDRLVQQYLGVVYQSNWDLSTDMPGARSWHSRLARQAKRRLRAWQSRWS